MLVEQDLQLTRLRNNIDDSNLNNFNPNYGCDGILNGHIDVGMCRFIILPQTQSPGIFRVVRFRGDPEMVSLSQGRAQPSAFGLGTLLTAASG